MRTLRKATLDDARALSSLAEQTFRDTFGPSNAERDMDQHCRASYGEAIQAAEIADPERLTLLCEEDGRLVGFAQLRWQAAPGCVVGRAPGEIQRLYVAADRHGTGVARELMHAALQALARRGADVAWLGVWEHNPRAIAFYRKWGFAAVGEHVFALGSDPQRDLIMARPVGR